MKEIGDDTNKMNDIHVDELQELILIKMSTLHKAIYRFSTTPIRMSLVFSQKFL
jgi:hypothetical protein